MFVRKSKIERALPIGELPKGKALISIKGKDKEGIWVARDEENKVMYLLNHALMFHPMPSWGMELPLCDEIDLHKYRGDRFEDTDITVCEEAYNHLKAKGLIGNDDEFDCVAFIKMQNSIEE